MAISKVDYFGQTLIDLTGDTVTAEKLLKGITAHDKAGNLITGTAEAGGGGSPGGGSIDLPPFKVVESGTFTVPSDTRQIPITLPSGTFFFAFYAKNPSRYRKHDAGMLHGIYGNLDGGWPEGTGDGSYLAFQMGTRIRNGVTKTGLLTVDLTAGMTYVYVLAHN